MQFSLILTFLMTMAETINLFTTILLLINRKLTPYQYSFKTVV
nr:Putative uncharacterized protein [Moritella viscosa]